MLGEDELAAAEAKTSSRYNMVCILAFLFVLCHTTIQHSVTLARQLLLSVYVLCNFFVCSLSNGCTLQHLILFALCHTGSLCTCMYS